MGLRAAVWVLPFGGTDHGIPRPAREVPLAGGSGGRPDSLFVAGLAAAERPLSLRPWRPTVVQGSSKGTACPRRMRPFKTFPAPFRCRWRRMAGFGLDSRLGSVRPWKRALVLGSVDGAFLLLVSGSGTPIQPTDRQVRGALPNQPRNAGRGSATFRTGPNVTV